VNIPGEERDRTEEQVNKEFRMKKVENRTTDEQGIQNEEGREPGFLK
jgi:hypothetical protein